jgi:curved DNA-binding protein
MALKYKDYYEILGVKRDATDDDIRRSYRKLAKEFHPDMTKGDKQKEEKFKEIAEAHEVLCDSEKRRRYDSLGANWQTGSEFTPPPGWEDLFAGMGAGRGTQGGRTFTFRTGSTGGSGFSEFFDFLFGGSGPFTQGGFACGEDEFESSCNRENGGAFQNFAGGRSGLGEAGGFQGRSQDVQAELEITIYDAYHRGRKTISLQRQNPDGTSSVQTLDVSIPAGIKDGSIIRLAGQGAPNPTGEPAGDLFITLKILPDPVFRAEGRDVYVDAPVSPWEAALGAKISVPTLSGGADLNIPAGVQSGQKLRLKGQGLPEKGGKSGDAFAVVKIVVPKNLTADERRLFEELRAKSQFKPR